MLPTATVAGAVEAEFSGQMVTTAASLNVDARSNNRATADAVVVSVSVGGAGVIDGNSVLNIAVNCSVIYIAPVPGLNKFVNIFKVPR